MTIQELIDELRKYDKNLDVVLNVVVNDYGDMDMIEIESVWHNPKTDKIEIT